MKIKKIIFVFMLSLSFFAYSEMVTCPHCNKTFDTKSVVKNNSKTNTFNKSDYEVWTSSKLKAYGARNLNKKIVIKNAFVTSMGSNTISLRELSAPNKIIWSCTYDSQLADKVIESSDNGKAGGGKDFYGYVSATSPLVEFHVTYIE